MASVKDRRRAFTDHVVEFGLAYAETVRQDHALFVDAFRERPDRRRRDLTVRSRPGHRRPARATMNAGWPQPRATNAVVTAACTASTRSTGTSAIAEPPKPPPVIRAPTRPGLARDVDGHVELLAGDLVVVAQRDVRGDQQRSERVPVVGPQRLDERVHPGHLADDVPCPSQERLRQAVEGVDRGLREVLQPELLGGLPRLVASRSRSRRR